MDNLKNGKLGGESQGKTLCVYNKTNTTTKESPNCYYSSLST